MEGTIGDLMREAAYVMFLAFLAIVFVAICIKILREHIRIGEKLVFLSAWIMAPFLITGFVSDNLFLINLSCAIIASFSFLEIVRS